MTDVIASARTGAIRVGLVGRGIGLSRTPAMHVAEGQAQGLDYSYDILDMDAPERADLSLKDIIDWAEAEGFAGLNVTFPYKIEVIGHLHDLSESAEALGAVNTVVFCGGKRIGHNTDLTGFGENFRRGMSGAGLGEVLLIGAGGAGAAVGHAMAQLGTGRLWIFDTDSARAEELATRINAQSGVERALPATGVEAVAEGLDGVINATPIGMAKLPGCPFPKDLLRPDLWVADIIYFPLETELLAAARSAGCRVLPGAGMTVFQAVRAFELFSGLVPDPARMRATFESLGA